MTITGTTTIILFILLLILLVTVVCMIVLYIMQRNAWVKAFSELTFRISKAAEQRVKAIKQTLQPYYSGTEELNAAVKKLMIAERALCQTIIDTFSQKDFASMATLDSDIEKLVEHYCMLITEDISQQFNVIRETQQKTLREKSENMMVAQEIFNIYISMTRASALAEATLTAQQMLDQVQSNPLTDMLPEDIKKRYDNKLQMASLHQSKTEHMLAKLFIDYLKLFSIEAPEDRHYSLSEIEFFIAKGKFPKPQELAILENRFKIAETAQVEIANADVSEDNKALEQAADIVTTNSAEDNAEEDNNEAAAAEVEHEAAEVEHEAAEVDNNMADSDHKEAAPQGENVTDESDELVADDREEKA